MIIPSKAAILGVGLTLTAIAGIAHAQTTAGTGSAALDVRGGVQVRTLQRLTLSAEAVPAPSASADAMIDASAVIQISGDPGRAYRIRLPRFVTTEGSALIEALTARGAHGDDATRGNEAIDTTGRDVIRLEGRLRLSPDTRGGATAMPLSVDVE